MHFLASDRRCDILSILHLLWREKTLALSEQEMDHWMDIAHWLSIF